MKKKSLLLLKIASSLVSFLRYSIQGSQKFFVSLEQSPGYQPWIASSINLILLGHLQDTCVNAGDSQLKPRKLVSYISCLENIHLNYHRKVLNVRMIENLKYWSAISEMFKSSSLSTFNDMSDETFMAWLTFLVFQSIG